MAEEFELAHVTPMDKAREYLGLSLDEFCDYVDRGKLTPYLLKRKDGNRWLFVRFFGHMGAGWPNRGLGFFFHDFDSYGTVYFDCEELRKFLDTFATQKDGEEAFTRPEQASMMPLRAPTPLPPPIGGQLEGLKRGWKESEELDFAWTTILISQYTQALSKLDQLEKQLASARGEIGRLKKELVEKDAAQGQGVDAEQAEALRKELEDTRVKLQDALEGHGLCSLVIRERQAGKDDAEIDNELKRLNVKRAIHRAVLLHRGSEAATEGARKRARTRSLK